MFGLDYPERFNFLDHESKQKASGLNQIDNLAKMLLNIASVRRTAPGGERSFLVFTAEKAPYKVILESAAPGRRTANSGRDKPIIAIRSRNP